MSIGPPAAMYRAANRVSFPQAMRHGEKFVSLCPLTRRRTPKHAEGGISTEVLRFVAAVDLVRLDTTALRSGAARRGAARRGARCVSIGPPAAMYRAADRVNCIRAVGYG